MKRFHEVAAIVGTLLMSAGLVACGTTAENVTRTDMMAEQTTAVKIQLAEEDTEAETAETTVIEVAQTTATESETTATAEEGDSETTVVEATTAPTVTTVAKATEKKQEVADNSSSQQDNAQPDPEPQPEPDPEPAPAPAEPVDDNPPEPDAPVEPLPTTPPIVDVTGDELTFLYNGQSLSLKESPDAFVAAVPPTGEPVQAPSCLGNGTDINYIYGDFTIYAWENEGTVMTIGIQITGAGAMTSKGITVGSSADDVVAAYGALYTEIGSDYVYSYDDCSLHFTIDNGAVSAIMYDYPM